MNIENILNEVVGIEYSNRGASVSDSGASSIEKYLARTIIDAFRMSPELQVKYGKNERPDDIIVKNNGSSYDIIFNQEDPVFSKTITISKQHMEKGVNKPNTMAAILLER